MWNPYDPYFNNEVDEFNRHMFDLSLTVPNLRFLDTHQALIDRPPNMTHVYDIRPCHGGIGCHLTRPAQQYVAACIANCVELLMARKSGRLRGSAIRGPGNNWTSRAWRMPLRAEYRVRFRHFLILYGA